MARAEAAKARVLANRSHGVQDQGTVTEAEGAANLLAGFAGHIAWTREFAHHPGNDGGTVYVDTRTGRMYDDGMPRLHSVDGTDH